MSDPPRRLPPPWRADPMPGGYVVRDASGQALAFIYSRETEAEAGQANVLTADEARRIAVNIARRDSTVITLGGAVARFPRSAAAK